MRKLILICAQLLLLVGPTVAWSDAPKFAPYCGKADFDDLDNGEQQEALCLRSLGQSVTRKGDVLSLKLDDGTFKTYRSTATCNDDDADHCVKYWIAGYDEKTRLYILLIGDYDGFDCMLVSARDGTETQMHNNIGGMPHFAPDGSTFIVIFEDSFAIGSLAANPPSLTRMEWTTDANDGDFWEFQAWLDNDHVALKFSGQSAVCPDGNCEAILAHIGDHWILQRQRKS
jgi:hypothetical protein